MKIPADMLTRMQQHEWFHAIDLGDGAVTCGRFPPDQPQNQTLFSVFDFLNEIDVRGMDCLDIGATDGLISFGLEKRGARSVVATDRVSGVGFQAIHDLLSSKVEHVVPVEISTINDNLAGRHFDLVICAGVIYHMLNPLSALMACRSLLRPGGLMIVETAMTWLVNKPVLLLNSEEEELMESSTYWTPTPSALKGMAKLCHFDFLGGRWQPATSRGAVLGRAVPHREPIANATTLLAAMHQHGLLDTPFVRQLEESDRQPASAIKFSGAVKEYEIDPKSYKPTFPLHAHIPDRETAIGLRDWRVVDRR